MYFNGGTGEIDYENRIGERPVWTSWQDKAGLGLARFGEGDFGYEWVGGVGFGKASFGSGEFGVDADIIEWVSLALEAGVYRFGVKIVDEAGNESSVRETGNITVIPAAKPADELSVLFFDKDINKLTLGVSGGK